MTVFESTAELKRAWLLLWRAGGGFVRRLTEDEGTWCGHILEHVAIEVQQLAGAKVTYGKTRSTGIDGEYHVVYQFEEERVGIAAGKLALRLRAQPDSQRNRHRHHR